MNQPTHTQTHPNQQPHSSKAKEAIMKTTLTLIAVLALAACDNPKTGNFAPKLTVSAELMQPLAAGDTAPTLDVKVSGTCVGNSAAGAAEEPKAETKSTPVPGDVVFDLCQGTFAVTFKPLAGWEMVSPVTSVTMAESTDQKVQVFVKKISTANVDTTALEAAIAALQAAITSGDPASVKTALDNLATAIAAVNGAVGNLQASIDALKAQALRILYPGSVIFTVADSVGAPLVGAVCTETNVSWASLPAGENALRTCTSIAGGDCEVKNLYLERDLRFECKATGFRTEANIVITLHQGTPTVAWEVRLQAAGNVGDLFWQNFYMASGAVRNITNTVFAVQADGTLAPVSTGLTCTIVSGANSISLDVPCTTLTGLAVGCGKIQASVGGKTVTSVVRVDGAGAPATCPP